MWLLNIQTSTVSKIDTEEFTSIFAFRIFQKAFFLLLSEEILDKIGKTIRLIAVGINNTIVFHWSETSYNANSEKFEFLTNIVLIIQNTGTQIIEESAAGSVNLIIIL